MNQRTTIVLPSRLNASPFFCSHSWRMGHSALILLVGAEVNQVIEWHIPGGKSEGEKVPKDYPSPGRTD